MIENLARAITELILFLCYIPQILNKRLSREAGIEPDKCNLTGIVKATAIILNRSNNEKDD